nr:Ig-like domain-containing protein [Candidatus Sigynarchaeota archaeon]
MKRTRFVMLLLASAIVLPCFFCQAQAAVVKSIKPATASDQLGAFIIILGDRGDHELVEQIKYGGGAVYDIVRALGFPTSKIYYLGPSYGTVSSHQNATSTPAHIQFAIENWTYGKVDSSHGLGIYLFDHGGGNSFCIGGVSGSGGNLAASTFDSYLDNFETKTGCNRIVLIYEACDSGSFIDDVSKVNRIICTASSDTLGSSVNPDGNWATFSQGFWGSIASGDTIGNAFIDACNFVLSSGYSSSDQQPWIDDDHNTFGHWVTAVTHTLPSFGDGSDALTTYIKYGAPPLSIHLHDFMIARISHVLWINYTKRTIPLWAIVTNMTKIRAVTARILPPGWTPPPPNTDGNGSWPVWPEPGVINFTLYDQGQPGNYSGSWTPAAGPFNNGTYRINYMVTSDDGTRFDTASDNVTVGAAPPADTTPPTIRIRTPYDGENVSGTVDVDVEAFDDGLLDSIAITVNGSVVRNVTDPDAPYEILHSLNTVSLGRGSFNVTAIATDKAGHSASASIIINVTNLLTLSEWIIAISAGIGVLAIAVVIHAVRVKKRKASSK